MMQFFKEVLLIFFIFLLFLPPLGEAKTADDWYNEGNELIQAGNFVEAIENYDEALKINPQYAGSWINKGFALNKIGKYEEAIKAYDEALKINPLIVEAWNNKGCALSRLGKNDEAIKSLDEALKINPQYAGSWLNKGIALHNLGRYEEAIKAFDEVLNINPLDFYAWYDKGAALHNIGRYEEANKAFDEVWKINPQFARERGLDDSHKAGGVMNTMLMSVSERTKEFGLLWALGAERNIILLMTIEEAIMVFLITGITAFVCGEIITHLFNMIDSIIEQVSHCFFFKLRQARRKIDRLGAYDSAIIKKIRL